MISSTYNSKERNPKLEYLIGYDLLLNRFEVHHMFHHTSSLIDAINDLTHLPQGSFKIIVIYMILRRILERFLFKPLRSAVTTHHSHHICAYLEEKRILAHTLKRSDEKGVQFQQPTSWQHEGLLAECFELGDSTTMICEPE